MPAHSIYSPIKPTVLMVKKHNKTGLLYFHKTWRLHLIETYLGSGTYWINHLNKNGNDVTTLWISDVFYDESIKEFAVKFSEDHDIVKSKLWANQKPETGLDGGQEGLVHKEESKQKTSESLLETRKEKEWGFSVTGKKINEERMSDGSHQFLNHEWHKKNNPWITNNPSKRRFRCLVTGKISTKSGFTQTARNSLGLNKWPHPLEKIE